MSGSGRTQAEGGPSSRQPSSRKPDLKSPQGPAVEEDDPLSSVPASPDSMGTIDEQSGYRDDDVLEEPLPPPYTPTATTYTPAPTTATPTHDSQSYREIPTTTGGYGSFPGSPESSMSPQRRQMMQEDAAASPLLARRAVSDRGNQWRQLYTRKRKTALNGCLRCCTCCLVAVLVLLLLVGAICVTWIMGKRGSSVGHGDPIAPSVPDGPPVLLPHQYCPNGLVPTEIRSFHHAWTIHPQLHSDPLFSVTERLDSAKIYIESDSKAQHGAHITGDIRLLPSLAGQKEPIVMYQTLSSTSAEIADDIRSNVLESAYELDLSSIPAYLLRKQHCTVVNMDFYIQPSILSQFAKALNVTVHHLSIELSSGLDLPVQDLFFHTTVGSVASARDTTNAARHIVIDVDAGLVNGTWPLRDVLDIRTVAGPINIQYVPKKALASEPLTPAELTLTAIAGSIQARPAAHHGFSAAWPPRRYTTRVHATSGPIVQSTLPLGESLVIETAAGATAVDVLPVAFPALTRRARTAAAAEGGYLAHLATTAQAGPTFVNVLRPAALTPELADVFNATHSDHRATAGAIDVRWPDVWYGRIDASTITGRVAVTGEGVEIVKDEKGWISERVVAVRRDGGVVGGSWTEVGSISGGVEVRVGRA